jgi:hypothetical protein
LSISRPRWIITILFNYYKTEKSNKNLYNTKYMHKYRYWVYDNWTIVSGQMRKWKGQKVIEVNDPTQNTHRVHNWTRFAASYNLFEYVLFAEGNTCSQAVFLKDTAPKIPERNLNMVRSVGGILEPFTRRECYPPRFKINNRALGISL